MAITQPAYIALPYNKNATLNISADAVVKPSKGIVAVVNVLTAGSAAGAIHNCTQIVDAAAGNKVATIPNTVGSYVMNFPCSSGIVYKVGTSQVVSISYL